MSKRLFVGNLPFSLTSEGLTNLFAKYGKLGEVTVVINKFNGRSKGFGFVTLEEDAQAATAISEMNGSEVEGRKLTVNEATPFNPDKPRERRPFRSGGGFGGNGGGRRFGGGGGRRFGGRNDRSESSDNF